MSSVLAIVGDDLTGVVSVAGEVAARGISTTVVPLDGWDQTTSACRVVSTATRNAPEPIAAARARQAAIAARDAEVSHYIKKVDSLLRGNIGAELKATQEVFDGGPAVCAFAAPLHGRTTVGGLQLVANRPILVTDDPGSHLLSPARGSNVCELLEAHLAEVRHIPLQVVTKGEGTLRSEMESAVTAGGVSAVVCDATTLENLRAIARCAVEVGITVFAGSSGLGGAVADALIGTGQLTAPPPALILSGTASANGRDQVLDATGGGFAELLSLGDDEDENLVAQTVDLLGRGRTVLLAAPAEIPLSQSSSAASEEIADRLAACACASLRVSPVAVAGVVATGGDVAEAFYRQLDSPPLIVNQEAIVGVPITTVAEGSFIGLRVAAKTGSFGAVEAFSQIVAWLQAREPEPAQSRAPSIPISGEEQ